MAKARIANTTTLGVVGLTILLIATMTWDADALSVFAAKDPDAAKPEPVLAQLHVPRHRSSREPSTPPSAMDYHLDVRILARMVKSPVVLASAVRFEEVAQLDVIKKQKEPADWLETMIDVETDKTGFIEIRYLGERSEDAVTIVNGVVKAFISEIVNEEQNNWRRRLARLEKVHRDHEEKLAIKRKSLRRLNESLAADSLKKQMDDDYSEALRKRLVAVRMLQFEESSQEERSQLTELASKLRAELLRLDKRHPKLRAFERDSIRAEIERSEDMARTIGEQISQLEIEFQQKPRVSVFRRAEL